MKRRDLRAIRARRHADSVQRMRITVTYLTCVHALYILPPSTDCMNPFFF